MTTTRPDPSEQAEQAIQQPAPGVNGKVPPEGTSPTAVGHPGRLLVDPIAGTPIPPKETPGYYPGYHTLDNQNFWDEATRKVVLERAHRQSPIRFFTEEEAALLAAVVARLLPQDDRDEAHRIPIVPEIDRKLYEGIGPGYQYRDLPPTTEVFKLGLRGVEAIALHVYHRPFQALEPHEQDFVLETIHDGHPPAGHDYWQEMPVRHFWQVVLSDVLEVYYAHPYAWDEIGYGGPAYPRGYMRLHGGEPEPWEVEEVRYDWAAPPSSLSDAYTPIGGIDPREAQLSGEPQSPAQGGTH